MSIRVWDKILIWGRTAEWISRKAARTGGTVTDSDWAEGELLFEDDGEHNSIAIDISETATEDRTTTGAAGLVDADYIESSDTWSSQNCLFASDRLKRSAAFFIVC